MLELIKNLLNVDNMSEVCRLCLNIYKNGLLKCNDKIVLYSYNCNAVYTLKDIFQSVFNELLYSENLPTSICENCFKHLNTSFILINEYKQKQKQLLDYTNQIINKLIDSKTNSNLKNNLHHHDNDEGNIVESEIQHTHIHNITPVTQRGRQRQMTPTDHGKPLAPHSDCVKKAKIKKTFRIRNKNIERMFRCVKCEGSYTTSVLARLHMKRAHKVFVKICSECGNCFKNQTELSQHINNKHESRKTVCQNCGLKIDKIFIDRHLKKCMGKDYKYKFVCDYCMKSWKTRAQIYSHIYGMHLYEKPFKCDICEKAFATKGYLKSHCLVHNRLKIKK